MIEINDLYKFVFKVNDGSGICLKFEDERKCYILTAYHCIKDSIMQKEKIELWNYKKISIPQKEKVYCNEDKDIALIEIDFIEDLLTISFEDEILPDDEVTFIGYPKKADSDRKRLNGKIIEWNDKQAINVEEHINGALTEDEKTVEVFSGFSGSGVFRKRGQKLTLVGLLKSLPEEDFDYKEITCISIEDIREFLDNKIFSHKYKVNKEVIEIIKDGKKLGEITIKTVPITMEDGRILNVSIYPVTFEEYDLFYKENKDILNISNPNCYFFPEKRGKYPVVNVSWEDSIEYCKWLNKKSKNFKYFLPDSSDWENVAKKNIVSENEIDNYVWHKKNTKEIQPVGTTKQGLYGIYDMYGNIYEWCMDSYDGEEELKIIMGNSFNSLFENFSIEKNNYLQFDSKRTLGFRIFAKKINNL